MFWLLVELISLKPPLLGTNLNLSIPVNAALLVREIGLLAL